MPNPVPNRRPPVYINQERVEAFLLSDLVARGSWHQEQARYLKFWRKSLNARPRASLRDDRLVWRVPKDILSTEKAQAAKLAVLRAFLSFLVARGDLRPDEDHLEGLPLSFFRAQDRLGATKIFSIPKGFTPIGKTNSDDPLGPT